MLPEAVDIRADFPKLHVVCVAGVKRTLQGKRAL